MSTVKRVYFYLVYLITLGIFAAGVSILLRVCFGLIEHPATVQIGTRSFDREMLSLGLAMLVIGGVLWFLFWRAINRATSGNTTEIGSTMRKLIMNLILVVSSLVGLFAATDFLRWLMSGTPLAQFPSTSLANLIVTGIIWYYHWRVAEKEGHPSPNAMTLRRWYVYILSGWGLVALSINLVHLINSAVLNLPVWGTTVIHSGAWNSSVQSNISWILLGGSAWAFHWFRMARGDFESTLRQVYLHLLAILGGSIAGLAALTTFLYKLFRFALGSLNTPTDTYFQFLGWTVPTMLVAAAVWLFHERVTEEEASQTKAPVSARRINYYLMSFLGLGTLIGGVIILLGILLEIPIHTAGKPILTTSDWWRDQLGVCLALVAVATPIWLYFWYKVLKMAAEGINEIKARSRRIFLYVVVGAAVITLAADLVNIVYQLLNGVLQGSFGMDVLRQSKWSLQTLVVAIPVLIYHWRILRQDQRLGAEAGAVRKTVTVLASDKAVSVVSQIEEKLGYKVRILHYLGEMPEDLPVMSDDEVSQLVGDIQTAPGTKVMLIAAGSRIMVLPYRD